MKYFNPTFLNFFKELSKNNTTKWFNENRKIYENEVKKPFADFVEEMITRIQKYEPEVQIKPSEAISRVNKDILFSKDKTPTTRTFPPIFRFMARKINRIRAFIFSYRQTVFQFLAEHIWSKLQVCKR